MALEGLWIFCLLAKLTKRSLCCNAFNLVVFFNLYCIYVTYTEYGMGCEVSTLGDIFSYGIMLLEIFTGKCPTGIMFRDGLNIHNFALNGISTCVEEIVDPMLSSKRRGK